MGDDTIFACIVRPYYIFYSMAHFHIKKKKGRPYLYIREIARVDGKPKVISQVYVGSPEKIAKLASGPHVESKDFKIKVEEYGALWLAHQIDKNIDIAKIVDEVIPKQSKELGPSVGEYFLYCIFNRMIHAVSKNKLAGWYKSTAIQQIRPTAISELTSQRYWQKWERVNEKSLNEISQRFFKRLWEVEKPESDCLLFDTTNYYTFMASDTESELAERGKNKEGRHNLRQIGLGLLVARESRLPLFYQLYPGNMHDSRFFQQVMDEMFGIVCGFHKTKERLTVIFDKGMNSENNLEWIDEHRCVHFITNYSTYFAQELASVSLDHFDIIDTSGNRRLATTIRSYDRLLAYRSSGEYWGKTRTVIVTYNPVTARKQNYTFESKLESLRNELLIMRKRVREREPHWRNADKVKERYQRLCERLHISTDFFSIELTGTRGELVMNFKKNVYAVDKIKLRFGKNIIITDNNDWSTTQIVEANLDRWQVENSFRMSKDDNLVGVNPVRHWTDSKIRCHLFTCVVALTYLRRIELRLAQQGITRSAHDVMEDMHNLHSVLLVTDGRRRPERKLEEPTKTQREVLTAFNHQVDERGVLHDVSS